MDCLSSSSSLIELARKQSLFIDCISLLHQLFHTSNHNRSSQYSIKMRFSFASTLVVALAAESAVASSWFSKAGKSLSAFNFSTSPSLYRVMTRTVTCGTLWHTTIMFNVFENSPMNARTMISTDAFYQHTTNGTKLSLSDGCLTMTSHTPRRPTARNSSTW